MPDDMDIDRAEHGRLPPRHLDEEIAALAAAQHDVFARRQLLSLAVSTDVIDRRVKSRRLHVVLRGVYSVTPKPTQRGWWMAAVLAAGPGAVLSHRAAAALHGMRPFTAMEVTVPGDRRLPRVIVHRSSIPSDEIAELDGIPTAGVSRTIFDLAAVVPSNHLERALRRAETDHLGDSVSLAELFDRYPRRRGSAKLRAVLADNAFTSCTRSYLEDRFLEVVGRHGIDRPITNTLVDGFECDAVWPRARLIAELDSRAFHAHTHAFEEDRRRDRVLQRSGWRVVRITSRQLDREEASVVADLVALLSAAAA